MKERDFDDLETLALLEKAKVRLQAIQESGDEAAMARATVLTLDLLSALKDEMGLADLSLREFLLLLFQEKHRAQKATGTTLPN